MPDRGVGVVVGRFQVPELHFGHVSLFKHVLARHSDVLVLLGVPGLEGTRRNPLDFKAREAMIKKFSRDFVVRPLPDHASDEAWSQRLDSVVRSACGRRKAVLYGGRDSFFPRYSGKLPKATFKSGCSDTATLLREHVVKAGPRSSEDFRAGAIYTACRMPPQLYKCVDIAVLDPILGLLLGRKHPTDGWCFPGGFVDPTDKSLEVAAKRELYEETDYSIETSDMVYVGSTLVDDWRYPGPDRIMTTLFQTVRLWGAPKAGDDLAQVRWFGLRTARDRKAARNALKAHHKPLFDMLRIEAVPDVARRG